MITFGAYLIIFSTFFQTIPFSLAIPIGGFVSPQLMQFTLTPFISGERFVIDLYSAAESVFHFRIDMPKDKQKV